LKRFRTGHILVTTDNPTYSQKLLQLTELAGVPIKVSPYCTLNNSNGVVRCGELKQCSNEEIFNELAPQGVTNSVNIKSKDGTVSNTFILSLSTPTPPKIIKVGYLKKTSQHIHSKSSQMLEEGASVLREVSGPVDDAPTDAGTNKHDPQPVNQSLSVSPSVMLQSPTARPPQDQAPSSNITPQAIRPYQLILQFCAKTSQDTKEKAEMTWLQRAHHTKLKLKRLSKQRTRSVVSTR